MKKLLILLLILIFISGFCFFKHFSEVMVNEQEAIDTLNNYGFTNIKVINSYWVTPSFFGCSEEDNVAFECTANNSQGKHTKVIVCSNLLFKNSTIRFMYLIY